MKKINVKNVATSLSMFAIAFFLVSFVSVKMGWVVPAADAAVKNPVKADAVSIAAGKTEYTKTCKMCHGATGVGVAPAGMAGLGAMGTPGTMGLGAEGGCGAPTGVGGLGAATAAPGADGAATAGLGGAATGARAAGAAGLGAMGAADGAEGMPGGFGARFGAGGEQPCPGRQASPVSAAAACSGARSRRSAAAWAGD